MGSAKRRIPVDLDRVFRCVAEEYAVQPILRRYPAHLQEQLKALRTALDADQEKEVHRIAHAIKGGALNLGAEGLGTAALEVERNARVGDLRAARSGLPSIEKEATRVSRYILKRYKE